MQKFFTPLSFFYIFAPENLNKKGATKMATITGIKQAIVSFPIQDESFLKTISIRFGWNIKIESPDNNLTDEERKFKNLLKKGLKESRKMLENES